MIIYGINPVVEALRAGRLDSIRISSRGDSRLGAIIDAAKKAGVAVKRVDANELDRAAHGGVHQGVVAVVQDQKSLAPEDLVRLSMTTGAPAGPVTPHSTLRRGPRGRARG